jgi:diguanylate cyclase (GGDEF)-like protein
MLLSGGMALATAGQQRQLIDFQLSGPAQFQFAGYYAAIEQGFYREEGLEVVLREPTPGRSPVEEVLSGHAQYGVTDSEILYGRLQGKPLVALAAIFQHAPAALFSLKDANIYAPHDLLGKKIMLRDPQHNAAMVAMFQHDDIKRDALAILPDSGNLEDLISGKVTALEAELISAPFLLTQRGVEYRAMNPATYGVDFYSGVLFTSEQEIEEHPEQVEAFRRASLKGWYYAMRHVDAMLDVLKTKYKVERSSEFLQFEAQAMQPLVQPDGVEIGHMNPERWRRIADIIVEAGMGDRDAALDSFIYNPFPPLQVAKLKKAFYLVSFVGGLVLFAAITLFIGWWSLKKEVRLRIIAEQEAKLLAYNDALTGIPNRNSFIPFANKQLLAANRLQQKIALCFIDLNYFKTINDNYGHKAGDAVLVHVAKAISAVIRESDMVARLGGDEFVVLLGGVHNLDDTVRIRHEIQQAIARPFIFQGRDLSVTASVGVALYPDDAAHIDDLINSADEAMFRDKSNTKPPELKLVSNRDSGKRSNKLVANQAP